jgi:two-component system, NtrC family, response regulator AtoC
MNEEYTRWKILIIEDDTDLADLIRSVLEKERYRVFCAANGWDGIRLHDQNRPDLILLDLRLPEMNGIETLRTIRQYDDKVAVVVLTGYACPDTIRDAAELNVSEYLSKPFANHHLLSVIGKACER